MTLKQRRTPLTPATAPVPTANPGRRERNAELDAVTDYAGIGYQYQYCKAAIVGTACTDYGDWTTIPNSDLGTTSYHDPQSDQRR